MHFPDLEKSWNLEKRPKSWKNHGISKYPYGKIMEKKFGAPRIPSDQTHCLGYYNCYNFYFECWMWL